MSEPQAFSDFWERIENMPPRPLLSRLKSRWKFREIQYRPIPYLRYRWARSRRGWAAQDTWGLDSWLGETLGTALIYLGENTHGWPPQFYDTFSEWTDAILKAGNALKAYAKVEDLDWQEPIYQQTIDEAKEALHWVAEHLPALWD